MDEMMQQGQPQGLAAQLGNTQPMRDVDQIVEMLMKGVSPEELIERGIPSELVDQAMQVVAQMMQVPEEQAGLAGMQLKNGPMR